MSRENDFKSLKQVNDIIDSIVEYEQIKKETVQGVVDGFFHTLSSKLRDRTMPSIMVTNWGSYRPSLESINARLRYYIRGYRKGRFGRELAVKLISELWPIRARIIKEKNGGDTYRVWSKIDSSDKDRTLKELVDEKEREVREKILRKSNNSSK